MPNITDDRDAERNARMAWSHIVEPGDGLANELIDRMGAAAALAAVLDPECRGSLATSLAKSFAENAVPIEARAVLKRWAARYSAADADKPIPTGVQALIPGDEHWPAQLDELISARSIMLWVRGDASLLASRSVAIVGARACTSYGEHVTTAIAEDLAHAGVTVVSGAAYGVDGAAHRAALAIGGNTIAVLASGVDRAYPAGHSDLITRIASQGAVVSEMPPGSTPTPHRFTMRSLLIAALANGVVVTEAGFRSGSLAAVTYAELLNKPVGAVPGPITSAASAGTNHLIGDRAAVLVARGADVLSMIDDVAHTVLFGSAAGG